MIHFKSAVHFNFTIIIWSLTILQVRYKSPPPVNNSTAHALQQHKEMHIPIESCSTLRTERRSTHSDRCEDLCSIQREQSRSIRREDSHSLQRIGPSR